MRCSWRSSRVRILTAAFVLAFCLASFVIPAQNAPTVYLSEHPDLIVIAEQGWGELGLNEAAHQAGQAGAPLQIGSAHYQRGLGHHANGSICILLDSEYASFDAVVGLQPCPGGSVRFRAFVDDQQRFDSGVMRDTSAPLPLHVELAGARELRLEAGDAGDGIACDMANWAEARLTRSSGQNSPGTPQPDVDIARFARVVTWDPNRMDGARSTRIQEYRAEDVFTETDCERGTTGTYTVPFSTNGIGCIGLQWLNRRAIRELGITLSGCDERLVEVQGWAGESAWQGEWKRLAGELHRNGPRLTFAPALTNGLLQTRKIRWIFPGTAQTRAQSLWAHSRARWATTNLWLEFAGKGRAARGELRILDGEFPGTADFVSWKLSQPLRVSTRFAQPSRLKSETTVLQAHLPAGVAAVAVEDVLRNGCVYLPDFELFVTRDPAPCTLAEYRKRTQAQRTTLEEVRRLPDQTFQQAMARTHHAPQREGPVMLSLACDNEKFVVERDGTLRFQAVTSSPGADGQASAGEMRVRLGISGSAAKFERTLEGGWLPIPLITTSDDGVVCRQRVFVAPRDAPDADPARLNRPSVCVAEFALTNTAQSRREASLTLTFQSGSRAGQLTAVSIEPSKVFALGDRLQALIAAQDTPLEMRAQSNTVRFAGGLAPGEYARVRICIADANADLPSLSRRAQELRGAVGDYWTAVLAPAMQIETPELALNDLIRSSQIRCLIAARNEATGARIAPWIAAMSYGPLESEGHSVIRGMDFLGHEGFARRSLDFFISRYNTNGFLTTGYTTFGTAWHLWTLGEHWRLYQDRAWLLEAAPEITRVGEWIERQLEKSNRRNAPESGLMPPGVMADWNSFAFHFALNAYYYAALREVGSALNDLGSPQGPRFQQKAAELRSNILRAYLWTQARSPALPVRNGTWIPHYPSQVHSPGKLADFFPGQDAGRSWCYDVELGAHQLVPTGVLEPFDREVERMMDHMEDVQFLSAGWFDYPAEKNHEDWFNLGGFSKVQPYYTRNCEIYALRDDIKPFIRSYFNTLAAMLNPEVLTFWEHFNHSGAWDKTHETGYFLYQTRTMLVAERGDQLWLAPLVTTNWLTEGKTLVVRQAPTLFGPVSYEIRSHISGQRIEADILAPIRNPPREIVLRLRHPLGSEIRSVLVNGRRLTHFDGKAGLVRLSASAEKLALVVNYR